MALLPGRLQRVGQRERRGRWFCDKASDGAHLFGAAEHGNASLYAILGVPRDASKKSIRKAYLDMAKRWHPDVDPSPGAKLKFDIIKKAYDTLTDDTLKKRYDAGLHSESDPFAPFGRKQADLDAEKIKRWRVERDVKREHEDAAYHMSMQRKIRAERLRKSREERDLGYAATMMRAVTTKMLPGMVLAIPFLGAIAFAARWKEARREKREDKEGMEIDYNGGGQAYRWDKKERDWIRMPQYDLAPPTEGTKARLIPPAGSGLPATVDYDAMKL